MPPWLSAMPRPRHASALRVLSTECCLRLPRLRFTKQGASYVQEMYAAPFPQLANLCFWPRPAGVLRPAQ